VHERLTKGHFIGLESLAKTEGWNIEYIEYLIPRFLVKGIVRLDWNLLIKQFQNIWFFVSCLWDRDRTVILGIAPYDYRLFGILLFFWRHKVNYFTSWANWDGGFVPRKTKFASQWTKKIWKWFLEEKISGLLCVSNAAENNLKKSYLISCKSVVVSHAYLHAIKGKQIDLNLNKIKVVIVGRLEPAKGIIDVFEIVDKVDKEKFEFLFIGDGSLKNEVLNFSESNSNVSYFNHLPQKELLAIYEEQDIQLLISKRNSEWEELFGMVIIEAMSKGVPTIATSHVGPREIITDNITGFLLKEDENLTQNVSLLLESLSSEKLMNMQSDLLMAVRKYHHIEIAQRWKEVVSV
jgi:glycosyltransferase involved in cell wall biosynthesis